MTRNIAKSTNFKAKETTVIADVKILMDDINAGNWYGAGNIAATIANIAYEFKPQEDLLMIKT